MFSVRSLCCWICVTAWFVAGINAVEAAPTRNAFRIAGWLGGVFLDKHTKAFERCAASKAGPLGTDISYSVDRQFRWKLTVSNPSWVFTKGAEHNANLTIGQLAAVMPAKAIAIGRDGLWLQTRDPVLLFAKLRIARQLRVVVGAVVLKFLLDGGEEVLSDLTQCVLRSTRYFRSRKSTRSIFDSTHVESNLVTHAEAKALASHIIEYARVPESKIVATPKRFSGLPIDAAWKAGLIIAGVTILEAPRSSDQIVKAVVARSLQACHGGFFFVPSPDVKGNVGITRMFTSCDAAESITSSYYLVMPRPKGGHYLLTVIGTGSVLFPVAYRAADTYEAKLRAIIMLAVSRLH